MKHFRGGPHDERPEFLIPPARYFRHKKFYIEEVWLPARRHSEHVGGRRQWAEAFSLIFLYDDCIRYHDGHPYDVPDIHEVCGECLEMRWVSTFLAADEKTGEPKKITKRIDRLEFFFLFCRIHDWEISQWERRQ
ncbi:MAG: hypothetical protein AAFQ13_04330 [Pseudomonadota bacterium]